MRTLKGGFCRFCQVLVTSGYKFVDTPIYTHCILYIFLSYFLNVNILHNIFLPYFVIKINSSWDSIVRKRDFFQKHKK